MRDLPRKDRVAMTALANAIEHEPPYGSEDHTSFGIGCVY